MVVGFVNATLMTLKQALGIILGAKHRVNRYRLALDFEDRKVQPAFNRAGSSGIYIQPF